MKLIDIVFLLIIGACLLVIAGCSDRLGPAPVVNAPAVLRTWTPQEECDLAHILAKYPADSVVWTLHDDWARMRREAGFHAFHSGHGPCAP
jgi:hypothetical protein